MKKNLPMWIKSGIVTLILISLAFAGNEVVHFLFNSGCEGSFASGGIKSVVCIIFAGSFLFFASIAGFALTFILFIIKVGEKRGQKYKNSTWRLI